MMVCQIASAQEQASDSLNTLLHNAPASRSSASTPFPQGPTDVYGRSSPGGAVNQIRQPLSPSNGNKYFPLDSTEKNKDQPAASATNDFQLFIEQSIGKRLPLFGYDFFEGVPSTFAPVDNVPVTADYVIGPGDELVIHIWGQVDGDIRVIVDRNGTINIPKIGVFNVAGIAYKDLQSNLKSMFSRTYRNFELSVTLGELRSIQVFVVGQAKRPGSYTIGSMSTLVNALFASGGPSGKGSMRRIQLKRGGTVVTEFDLYDLILNGDKSKDVRLLPGDVIFIPPVGSLVAIHGSVNVPAIFEIKNESASISDVLSWTGGLTSTAFSHRVLLERIEAHKARKVDEFNLDGASERKHMLRDGDLLTFTAVSPRFENAVTLRGFVAEPARYPYREGMRIKDLLPNKDAVVSRSFWRSRNRGTPIDDVSRTTSGSVANSNNVSNTKTAKTVNSARPDNQTSASEKPGLQQRDIEKLQADIKRVEEVNWDYAVIERIQDDLSVTLIPFNLGKAILNGDPSQNILLKPGDIITVFSTADIQIPVAKQSRYVRLEGELASAGIYRVQPGETLRQLVARVSGTTSESYLFAAEFTRESTRVLQQQQLDEAINRLELALQRSTNNRNQVATTAEEAQIAKQTVEGQEALIGKLRNVRATGRIVLNLPLDNAMVKDLPDLPLEDGDRFFVPSRPSVVNVFGAVFAQNSFIYTPGKRVSDYLSDAGGPTRDADKSQTYVLRANGSVKSKESEGWSSLDSVVMMPGDAVVIPERAEKFSFTKELKDWSQIIYQFALGAAGLKVLNGL